MGLVQKIKEVLIGTKSDLDGNQKPLTKEAKRLLAAAERGNVDAQYRLGHCLYSGEGMEQDFGKAAAWLKKAAEGGEPNARFLWGISLLEGKGTDTDPNQAEEMIKGTFGATDHIEKESPSDDEKLINWHIKAAETGNAEAQFLLGVIYYEGENTTRNFEEAIRWYQAAAEQGHAEAQYNLGYCYADGQGVGQDMREAFRWFKKAADQSYEPAIEKVHEFEPGLKEI